MLNKLKKYIAGKIKCWSEDRVRNSYTKYFSEVFGITFKLDEEKYEEFFKKIVKDIHSIYNASSSDDLNYKKKDLKCKIERIYNVDTTANTTMMVTVIMGCVVFGYNLMGSLKNRVDPKNIYIIDKIDNLIIIFFVISILIVVAYISVIHFTKIKKGFEKSFLLLCLDILEEVQDEKLKELDKEEIIAKEQIASTRSNEVIERFESITKKVNDIDKKVEDLKKFHDIK